MEKAIEHDSNIKKWYQQAKRIVIKVGSAVLTNEKGLDTGMIHQITNQIAALQNMGKQVTLVSSGAVAAGIARLQGRIRPKTIPEKQAMAAIGQARLMQAYEEAFQRYNIEVAQVLLTRAGLIPRTRYVNAKNTLKTLIGWDIIPIINENDTVSTEELQFTDNDALAVLVVNLVEADMLVILSDIDGLYEADPRKNPDARRIPHVTGVTDEIISLAGDEPGRAGRGGMKSKLEAARMVTACGIPMVIAHGRTENILQRLFDGESIGTFFQPESQRRVYGRKPWIAYALKRKGIIEIDDGAVKALTCKGKSLLPVGIKGVSGRFNKGDCVVCVNSQGKEIAVGISNFDSEELKKLCGAQSCRIKEIIGRDAKEEAIHRDHMITL